MNNINKKNIFSTLDKKKIKEQQSREKNIIFYLSMALVISTTFFHAFSKDTKKALLTSTFKGQAEELFYKASSAIPASAFFFIFFMMLIPSFCKNYTEAITFPLATFFFIILLLKKFSFNKFNNIAGLATSFANIEDISRIKNASDNVYKETSKTIYFTLLTPRKGVPIDSRLSKAINAWTSNMFDFFSPIVVMLLTQIFLSKEVGNIVFHDNNNFQSYCGEVGTYGTLIYSSLIVTGLLRGYTISFFVDNSIYFLLTCGIVIIILFFILQSKIQKYKKISGISPKISFEQDMLTKSGWNGIKETFKFIVNNDFLRKILVSEFLFFCLQVLTDFYSNSLIGYLSQIFEILNINDTQSNHFKINDTFIIFQIFEKDKLKSNNFIVKTVFSLSLTKEAKNDNSRLNQIFGSNNKDSKELSWNDKENKIKHDIGYSISKDIVLKEKTGTRKIFFHLISQFLISILMEIHKHLLNSYLKNKNLNKKNITFDKFQNINSSLQSVVFILVILGVCLEYGVRNYMGIKITQPSFNLSNAKFSKKTIQIFYFVMYIYFALVTSLFRFSKYVIMDSMRNNWNSNNLKLEEIRPVKAISETLSSRVLKEFFCLLILKPTDMFLSSQDLNEKTNIFYLAIHFLVFMNFYYFSTKNCGKIEKRAEEEIVKDNKKIEL